MRPFVRSSVCRICAQTHTSRSPLARCAALVLAKICAVLGLNVLFCFSNHSFGLQLNMDDHDLIDVVLQVTPPFFRRCRFDFGSCRVMGADSDVCCLCTANRRKLLKRTKKKKKKNVERKN